MGFSDSDCRADISYSYPAITIPHMHEEPTASVMRILQLEQAPCHLPSPSNSSEDASESLNSQSPCTISYKAHCLPQFRNAIYGGQILGQSLIAAYATVEPSRHVHSMHASFIQAGACDKDLLLTVEKTRDGRSFSSRCVTAHQNDSTLYRALFSFQLAQPGLTYQRPMHDVPPAHDVPDVLEIFQQLDHPVARFLGKTVAFQVRHIDGNLYLDPPSTAQNHQYLWLRARHRLPDNTSQAIHRAFLAYVTDQFMLEPALRSHGLSWRDQRLIVATLDHAMWFHHDVNVNDWLLFEQTSPCSQGGRSMAHTYIYRQDGTLVATVMQEGMIRLRNDSQGGHWSFYGEDNFQSQESEKSL